MITSIEIAGFKRFESDHVPMAPLTVLTGLNGSGKTSLVQAILLLCGTKSSDASVALNGPYGLELGTAGDVLNWASEGPIKIVVHDPAVGASEWMMTVPSEEALYLELSKYPAIVPQLLQGGPRSLTFLCAERLGPRGFSQTLAAAEIDLEVGRQGEFCAHVLSVLGDQIIAHPERSHPKYEDPTPRLLKYEVEHWLGEIARPIEINGERPPGTTIAELRYRTFGADWVRATNMGFGITYALPVILGGLIAEPGGLLVVENPEAHLHPAGQSRMGTFLAWLAGKGVQVIVETHSDHVINGIRRGIAEWKYLQAQNAIILYFSEDADEIPDDRTPRIFEALSIDDNGSLSNWPRGFFDQYQIDVATLGQIRRRGSA